MTKKTAAEPGALVPRDVRITNVAEIPAKYFLHDEVSAALQRVIRTDVIVYGNPVPPGAEAVFGSPMVRPAFDKIPKYPLMSRKVPTSVTAPLLAMLVLLALAIIVRWLRG